MTVPSARGSDGAGHRAAALAEACGRTGRRTRRAALATWLVLCGSAAPALAQLSAEDLAALTERGRAEGWTFTVGPSEATTRPLHELCGAVQPTDRLTGARFDPCAPGRDLPASFDWRYLNGCTPIRSQGGCGSCWAFAAIGAVECAILIQDGLSTNLSEQWLISCTSAGSCSGGWHGSAFEYLRCNGWTDPCGDSGAVPELDFLYEASDAPCECPYTHAFCIDDWAWVGSGTPSPNQIKQAIYDHGPVATLVYVNDAFHGYSGGVFNACENDQGTNHVVVLVGWNDAWGTDGVWILRNSWDDDWGVGGYMYIEYGCSRVGQSTAYVTYTMQDCNDNGVPDGDEIAAGSSEDCNSNAIPDECEPDIPEDCEPSPQGDDDCNGNGRKDLCDLACGISTDENGNGLLDECEDCNGNFVADDSESPIVLFDNVSVMIDPLDVTAPVAQDIHLPGTALLSWFTVYYTSTGSSPGNMMVRFFDGGAGGGDLPVYPEGLIEEYALGQLQWLSSGFAWKTVELETPLWLPSHLWMEVEIDQDAGVILRAEPAGTGFTQGLVYDREAGGMLPDCPLYMSLKMLGVQCLPDCNANGLEDACDLDCGPAEGDCDLPGCGQSPDCNANSVPDECDLLAWTSQDCNSNSVPDECEPDSDGDNVIDACDECPFEPALAEPSEPDGEVTCTDAIDNDCDGLTDAADPDCGPLDCTCGDVNKSGGTVDLQDFGLFALCYGYSGPTGGCTPEYFECSDLNGSGLVDLQDFGLFALWYGQTSPQYPPNCTP